jgi:hypothetical protein
VRVYADAGEALAAAGGEERTGWVDLKSVEWIAKSRHGEAFAKAATEKNEAKEVEGGLVDSHFRPFIWGKDLLPPVPMGFVTRSPFC